MPRRSPSEDTTTLQMAIVGYEIERQKIDERIKELRAQLGRKGTAAGAAAAPAPPARKRNLSPAARRRIALAQRKRWAEHRKKKAAESKESKGE